MEHRWGERVALHLTVELSCGSSRPIAGSLENVSASGAFVRTVGRGPPRGPVEVMLHARGSGGAPAVRLAAYVVRDTDTGVGIEWCEFAPRPVRELIIGDRRRGRARARARVAPARPSPRAPEALVSPAGQPAAESLAVGVLRL